MHKANYSYDELILGKNVQISNNAKITGGKIVIGNNTVIGAGARIDVSEYLEIGKNSIIGEHTIIRGRDIILGREFYSNHNAEIGGGSCFEKKSSLRCGYWCHLGSYSMINTAMSVKIGNEVGLGRFSNIYTHGSYLSKIEGFPVTFKSVSIGNRVWIPSATINPGVKIGNDVVIGVGSVVTKDVPSGTLATGIPCRVIKNNCYPIYLDVDEKDYQLSKIFDFWGLHLNKISDNIYSCTSTIFDFNTMKIEGPVSQESELVRNILRRNGIRFKVETDTGYYEPWAI